MISAHFLKGLRRLTTAATAPPSPGVPFHLAIPVHSIPVAREFYGGVLGLAEGRRDGDKWQDYSLAGHQLVCHYVGSEYRATDYWSPVDRDDVPVPHFGLSLPSKQLFDSMAARLEQHKVQFIIKPTIRFEGLPGEQWTMFLKDPSNNNLEFKCMKNHSWLFARYNVASGPNKI